MPSAKRLLGPVIRCYPLAVLLLGWELFGKFAPVPRRLFPGLELIWDQLVALWQKGDIQYHGAFTLGRALAGFALAVAVGVAIGFLMARYRWIDRLFEPLFSSTYPIPKISLYPIFIFVLGIGTGSKIALVFLECLYPIAINTYYGTASVERSLLWAGRNMGASGRQLFWRITLPASLPYIFAGLRIALPIALVLAIITEMIGSNTGLGYVIVLASSSFQPSRVFAGLVVIAALGFTLDRLLVTAGNRLLFWQQGA